MNLKNTLKILLIFVLSSCASVPDIFVCADLDATTGYCAKTVTDEEKEVTGEEWDQFKKVSLKISVDDWAQLKAYILKQCKKNKQCSEINLTKKLNMLESSAFVNE